MRGTLSISCHEWRGFGFVGGLLGTILVLGFISVQCVPFLLEEWLRDKLANLKKAVTDDPASLENAARGVVPLKHPNGGKPVHVRSGEKK